MGSTELSPSEVKRLIGTPLAVNATWFLVSAKWWEVWKEAAQLDADEPAAALPEMEPIDNADLVDADTGLLRLGMVEHANYAMVPLRVWEALHSRYGGGPTFKRRVVARGIMREPKLELYPLVVRLHRVTPEGDPEEARGEANEPMALMVSTTKTTQHLKTEVVRALGLTTVRDLARLWFRYEGEEWQRFSSLPPSASLDGCVDAGAIDVMGEERSSVGAAYPRDVIVEAWRADIKVGDLLDAQDSSKKWFEGIVRDIDGDTITMHYKGWSERFNETIERSSPRLQPLYTAQPNWREFRVNDQIEAKLPNLATAKWVKARVRKVDRAAQTLEIQLQNASKQERTVPFDSEEICNLGTHLKRERTTVTRYSARQSVRGTPVAAGSVGLMNLGNTCFMNSMLQCMSHVQVLTEHFLSANYRDEVNVDNPLGMGGRLAEAYGALLTEMWSGEYATCVPSELKMVIGQHAQQFQGYQQQDSQEFMNFLLDGLHEDLNRVVDKPYTETVESDGRPDAEVAAEAWERHLLRNDSVVVDHVQGQLKSHVTCPVCNKESITFDPFMCLSVPLPTVSTRKLRVKLVRRDRALPPLQLVATVEKLSAMADLREKVAELAGVADARTLAPCQLFSSRFFRYHADSRSLPEVRDDSLVFYELPLDDESPEDAAGSAPAAGGQAGRTTYSYAAYPDIKVTAPLKAQGQPRLEYLELVHRRRGKKGPSIYATAPRYELWGLPLILPLPKRATGAQVHAAVWEAVQPVLNPGFGPENAPFTVRIGSNTAHDVGVEVANSEDARLQLAPRASTIILDWADDAVDRAYNKDAAVPELHETAAAAGAVGAGAGAARGVESLELEACLDKFAEREQLGEADPWYCPECREHRRAFKQMGIWKLPDVLIVHLKRFQYAAGSYFVHRDKLDALVEFPVEGLDMSRWCINEGEGAAPPIYDLTGVSQHSGGLGGGHYTAVSKNFRDGEWYYFNDSSVSPASAERAVTPLAYVLFYKRRGAVPPGAPSS